VARNLNTGLGIQFQPGIQEGLVNNRGSDMVHEFGLACSKCRTSDVQANMVNDGKSQTRNPLCPICAGTGTIYRDPYIVRGLATSIRQERNILDAGEAQPGDMQFSITPDRLDCADGPRRVSRDDRFTAMWSQPLDEGQTIVRAAATLEDNARFTNNVDLDADKLYYEPERALWCEDEDQVRYRESGDFSLGPGKQIRWVGNRPDPKKKYVLKYNAYFEWVSWKPPQERVDRDNRDLGPLIFLRRRHVALSLSKLLRRHFSLAARILSLFFRYLSWFSFF